MATDSNSTSASTSVSNAGEGVGISRRDAMNMMTAVAAVPAVSMVPMAPAMASLKADRTAWDRAVAHLRAAQSEYERIDPLRSAAFEAAEAECPRRAEFFSRYNLGCYDDQEKGREWNFAAAHITVVTERTAALRRALTPEEAKDATAQAKRIVDEFDDWVRRRGRAHARHDCEALEARFNAVVDRHYDAQDALLATEAPDHAAVLAKLEILVSMMDGQDDQKRVVAIRDDARRLPTIH